MALIGKTAVVTGAAMGIGKAMTEILLKNGAKVVLLDVNETAGKDLKEALDKEYEQERTLFLNCNVESEEQFKAALQRSGETFGGIDILCNNAGIMNEAMWEKTVSINLMGVIRGTYLALEHMSKLSGGRGGVIVNTASVAGFGPLLSCPVYTATKHGVVGFTRAMAGASTVSGYGIRFNVVCPSFIQTELFSSIPSKLGQFIHLAPATQAVVDKYGMLNVSEVAEALLELVTDETKNGQALMVTPKGKQYMAFPSFNS
ncbi:15-hydroxyprostaglandin dehydrogenase [NAD(+)]-like [Centropristis striata]|uniref:15-hydroxyprostaglandin dehydrogenase [NAD(+)]-like n=1 Tax=Centropristis striata TaxID=184440 RepID=UPI0027E1F8DB|nr:15-hydroxyprostaglandin dehydrogenase [NAD(+)]-like [Centropristis striata]XP_059207595.1 15-hydroxyprostaglandin dehydrogenase [NAD(+)]-like [Centropristis striata]